MERVPESSFGDEIDALTYARADFAEANALLLELITAFPGCMSPSVVLDVGCGPADIMVALARAYPEATIHGIDPWPTMVTLARQRLLASGLSARTDVVEGFFPDDVSRGKTFDLIVCASTYHHFADPGDLWRGARAVAARGATIAVWDLLRPASLGAASAIVERVAGDAPPLLKRDFMRSLQAGYRLDEVNAHLAEHDIPLVARAASERHWLVLGTLPDSEQSP